MNWKIYTIFNEKMFRRIDENGVSLWVPEDESNRHYQEYLAWLAEGNEPEVIDG